MRMPLLDQGSGEQHLTAIDCRWRSRGIGCWTVEASRDEESVFCRDDSDVMGYWLGQVDGVGGGMALLHGDADLEDFGCSLFWGWFV